MRRLRLHWLLVAVLAALTATGCDSGDTPAPTPTPDPAPTISETFTGTLGQNGAVSFSFTTKAAGTVTARLTTVGPDATLAIGLSLGTWDGTACNIVVSNDAALVGMIVAGSVSGAGSLCVRIYDAGRIPAPNPNPFQLTFEMIVVHP